MRASFTVLLVAAVLHQSSVEGASIGGSAWGKPTLIKETNSAPAISRGRGATNNGKLDESDMYISEEEVQATIRGPAARSRRSSSAGGSFWGSTERTDAGGQTQNPYENDKNKAYDESYDGSEAQDGEIGLGRIFSTLGNWARQLPPIGYSLDPVINLKIKKKINMFGAFMTVGADYLSELSNWRLSFSMEDALVGGRFSVRGNELGWTKSWLMNLGLGEASSAKIKLRMGLNLKNYKAYARVRFRAEPLAMYDIGEGLVCAGRLPLMRLLPAPSNIRSIPFLLEYKVRVNTPQVDFQIKRGRKDGTLSLTTGIDSIHLSVEELNFCLELDETSNFWGLGLVRNRGGDTARRMFNRLRTSRSQPPPSSTSSASSPSGSGGGSGGSSSSSSGGNGGGNSGNRSGGGNGGSNSGSGGGSRGGMKGNSGSGSGGTRSGIKKSTSPVSSTSSSSRYSRPSSNNAYTSAWIK